MSNSIVVTGEMEIAVVEFNKDEEFPELVKKLPSLWTRSKFLATIGSVSLDIVKKYIETQKNR